MRRDGKGNLSYRIYPRFDMFWETAKAPFSYRTVQRKKSPSMFPRFTMTYEVFAASRNDEMALIDAKFSWRQVAADFENTF
jgi:hypothetical protein